MQKVVGRGALGLRLASRSLCSKPKGNASETLAQTAKEEAPQFGKKKGGSDDAPAQLMHEVGAGRYEYIGDFMKSMNKGPVKLDFSKDAKPLTEKQKRMDQVNENNLQMIKKSLIFGSALAGVACFLGWQVTKWYYGVKNVTEFSAVMKERMPKVSGKLEDSAVGRKLKEKAETDLRDGISESEELAAWRRSLRGKFNSPEGAAVARQNSLMLAERREAERALRKEKKSSTSAITSTTASKAGATVEVAESAEAAEVAQVAAELASAASGSSSESAKPATGGLLRSVSARAVSAAKGFKIVRTASSNSSESSSKSASESSGGKAD